MPRSRLANLLVAIVVGALFLAGLFIHGAVGGLLLLVVAAFLGYLSAHTWSTVHPRGRGARILVVAVVVAVAVAKFALG